MKSQSKIPRVLSQGNEMEMRKTVIAPVIRMWAHMDITLYQKKYGIIMASLYVDRSCCCLLMVPVERRSSEWLLLHVILFSWFGLPSYYIMQIFLAESGFNIFSIFFFLLHVLKPPRYFWPHASCGQFISKVLCHFFSLSYMQTS